MKRAITPTTRKVLEHVDTHGETSAQPTATLLWPGWNRNGTDRGHGYRRRAGTILAHLDTLGLLRCTRYDYATGTWMLTDDGRRALAIDRALDTVTRHVAHRACSCATCWNRREGRPNGIRCGRNPRPVPYWTVGDDPQRYELRADAVTRALEGIA